MKTSWRPIASELAISMLVLALLAGCLGVKHGEKLTQSISAKSDGHQVEIMKVGSNPLALAYESGMTIDADGAPDAYAPDNKGTDDLSNGGKDGNWWALVTSNNKPDGTPIVRNGYYVSMTSLEDDSFPADDPRHYVNANVIPFFVLPQGIYQQAAVHLGDLGVVVNLENGKWSGAIFADEGPVDHLGEGSIALAKKLDIDPDPRAGGTDGNVLYIVFPGSGNGKPQKEKDIADKTSLLLKDAGGIDHFVHLWKKHR